MDEVAVVPNNINSGDFHPSKINDLKTGERGVSVLGSSCIQYGTFITKYKTMRESLLRTNKLIN